MTEGMALASVILGSGRGTAVPPNAICESACALAFMAGQFFHPEGERSMSDRIMHPTARLGFHAPDLDVSTGAYSEAEVERAFGIALETLALITERRTEVGYQFPESLFLAMLRTPADSMFYIETVGQASRLGIAVGPTALFGGPVEAALINACTNTELGNIDIARHAYSELSHNGSDLMSISVGAQQRVSGQMGYGFRGEAASTCDISIFWGEGDPLFYIGYTSIQSDWSQVYPYHTFPYDTLLRELPTDFEVSMRDFISKASDANGASATGSCWVSSPEVRVVNVTNFVNLRERPGFSGRILREVPLSGRLRVIDIARPVMVGEAGFRQRCNRYCLSARDGDVSVRVRQGVQQCVEDSGLWYEVVDDRNNRGWVSRNFLQEID